VTPSSDIAMAHVDGPAGKQPQVYRPVQYLGSKLRSLEDITAACTGVATGPAAWDAFTGSTVVAQSLARAGLSVVATDTQVAPTVFARALLGVDRPAQPERALSDSVGLVLDLASSRSTSGALARWIAEEDRLLAEGDITALRALYKQFPQRGSHSAADAPSAAWLADHRAPMSSTFAGTYFGIRQAASLDSLRMAILAAVEGGRIGGWEADAMLTALCSAASAAAHSAGKHFAQPLGDAETSATFRNRRLIQDRNITVDRCFEESVRKQIEYTTIMTQDHHADQCDATIVSPEWLSRAKIGVVYADPPYTAQQYSRFYHLLDTLIVGRTQPLQLVRGRPTRGLYPENRYLSPFCSRSKSHDAFHALISATREAGAALVLSYSTANASSRNARMIELNELVEMTRSFYGSRRVSTVKLGHAYRDFNRSTSYERIERTNEVLVMAELP
jgi:adenine-specific DNA methylase